METKPLEEEIIAEGELEVYGGKHTVPSGVGVEELDGGKQKLSKECPAPVKEILDRHDLMATYDRFVASIVESSATRGFFGGWKDKEFETILSRYKDEFAERGVKVALCKYKSAKGTYRWLEFIDTGVAENYVPQYDYGNRSGQVIKTTYNKLQFPRGVAVEELGSYGKARKKLKEEMPVYVKELMTKKDLMDVYQSLVDEMADAGSSALRTWDTAKLYEIAKAFEPRFQEKGVDVYVSQKEEYVSHGQYGGHNEIIRWLEFVDRDEQPNYKPQRDAKGKNDCVVM